MKIKLTSFTNKDELEFYGLEIGGVYRVVDQCGLGEVVVKNPRGVELRLSTTEFEIISED